MKQVKCQWCGRVVRLSNKGGLMPHRSPGNTYCVGGGQKPIQHGKGEQ